MTGLGALANSSASVPSSARDDGFKSIAAANKDQRSDSWSDGAVNCWSVLHDVGSCLESAMTSGSPSGYALDAASAHISLSIPPPPLSVACHLPYDRLQPVSIPSSEEYEEMKLAAIALPPLYQRSAQEINVKLTRIRERLVQYSQSYSMHNATGSSSGSGSGSAGNGGGMDYDAPTSTGAPDAPGADGDDRKPAATTTTATAATVTAERAKKAGPAVPGLKLPSLQSPEELSSSALSPAPSHLPPAFNKAFLVRMIHKYSVNTGNR